MWVEVIKPYVAHLGAAGRVRYVPDAEGEIHVLLGNAVEVKPPEETQPQVRKKRVYRRRDLKAEE